MIPLRRIPREFLVSIASILAIALSVALRWLGVSYGTPLSPAALPLWLVILVGGIPLLWGIIRQTLRGEFGTDILAAISVIVATILGEYYAAVLVILMLSGGQALESFAMRRASSVLGALARRMPSMAHRRRDGQLSEISVTAIEIGDEVIVFPHETCPVDGVVTEGYGVMDESYLTGEPYAADKAPGTQVLSGSINGDTLLAIRAEKLAADSRFAQIMRVMEEAEQKRPTLRRLGDQLGSWFTPLALLVAGATWAMTGSASRFLSVLVIATPCPLLIAIPIAIISAISLAARRGIIVKDPTVLERLPLCRTAVFDKTGTLTYGRPELTDIATAEGAAADRILAMTASVEHYSKHPLAGAILDAAKKRGLPLSETTRISERPGQGLLGIVDGQAVSVTSRKQLSQLHPEMLSLLPPAASGMECVVLINEQYAATMRFRDTPRADGSSFISHLSPHHQFDRVVLLSGDRESEVRYLAEAMEITEMYASQSPEQKVTFVREAAANGPTLFMGDGINDAPALAAATVGLAFGQGAAVTAESAGAVILESSLVKVDELLHISIAMRKIAVQSAVGGMIISLIGMIVAALGFITPVAGALIQEGIDVIAIVNALRLTFHSRIETDM